MKFVANGNLGGLVILLGGKKVAAEKPVSVGIHYESGGGGEVLLFFPCSFVPGNSPSQ